MQLHKTHKILHYLLLIGLLLPLLIQPKQISAQDNEPEPNFMVVEYAELHNLSYEEAERRLQLQVEMSALEGQIINGEPTYAGSWMQHEPEFGLTVAFTVSNGQEIIQKYLDGIAWADLVEVRQAKYTVGELTDILILVTQAAHNTGIPFESGDNIPAGKVTLYTPNPEELRHQLETQGAVTQYIDDIEYIYQERLSVPQAGSDEQDPGVESYAKLIGISLEEAGRRLKLQIEMDSLERKVLEGEPSYAGSWTVHEPKFGLVIAFAVADGEERLKPYLKGIEWANLVKVEQSPYTDEELVQILEKVTSAAKDTGVPFEVGANPRTAKVDIYTPEPDKLRAELEAQNKIPDYMDDISFIFQEFLSGLQELKYPYLPGGTPLSVCTAGFAVKRNSDNRRFMMTAAHCPDIMQITYDGANNIDAGKFQWETLPNDAFADIQIHDVSVRSLDLTNGILINPGSTIRVSATEVKATTMNDYVCKYGKTTAYTCGYVVNITYNPNPWLYPSGNFVRVNSPSGVTAPIACRGDSGGPWFKPALTNEVIALGIHKGSNSPDTCVNTANTFAAYTPVDAIISKGFTILTSRYPQRYHQNVYFTNGTCSEYVTPYNDDGGSACS